MRHLIHARNLCCVTVFLLLLGVVSPLFAQVGEANLSPKIALHRLADQYLIDQRAGEYKKLIEAGGELDPLPALVSRIKAKLEMATGHPLDLHVIKAKGFGVHTFQIGRAHV